MALPVNWPPRHPTGRASGRIFFEGTTTANFADNAVMFAQLTSANVYKATPYVAPGSDDAVVYGTVNAGGQHPLGAGQDPHDTAPWLVKADQGQPLPQIWSQTIIITNTGAAAINVSFDGVNIHGRVKAASEKVYRGRMESGISLAGVGGTANAFFVEAW